VKVYLSTCRVLELGRSGSSESSGTAFFLSDSMGDTARPSRTAIMVTARHVLDSIAGDSAKLFLRRWTADGDVECVPHRIGIRGGGGPKWTSHPDESVDVAVMRIHLPSYADSFMPLISVHELATDSELLSSWIGPGTDVRSVGFPYGLSLDAAASPFLRQGIVASYPVAPAAVVRHIAVDIPVNKGCSGGPVYMDLSPLKTLSPGGNLIGRVPSRILGLVSGQYEKEVITETPDEVVTRKYQLAMARVEPAQFIREAIDLLPPLK
jgi:S1-C subfamily serine protease